MTDISYDTKSNVAGVKISAKELVEIFEKGSPDIVKQVFGVLGDSARAWRVENIMKIIKKYKANLKKYKLTEKEIPLKFFFPFIATASTEDGESLQEKWANLLLNATSGNIDESLNNQYIETLHQLTGYDAYMLDRVFDFVKQKQKQSKVKNYLYSWLYPINDTPWSEGGEIDAQMLLKIRLIQDNLIRLEILQSINKDDLPIPVQEAYSSIFSKHEEMLGLRRKTEVITFTPYGYSFVQACRKPFEKNS